MKQSEWAREVARTRLEKPLPRRWAHTQGVARQARSLAHIMEGGDADMLEAAAWLHDIGYSPLISGTGFHPLDGARYLEEIGAHPELCRLVAHHTCAMMEAEERGLSTELLCSFAPADGHLTEALIYCDMTTSPDGYRVSVEERIDEIAERYGPGHVVTRFVERARGHLIGAVESVSGRLSFALI